MQNSDDRVVDTWVVDSDDRVVDTWYCTISLAENKFQLSASNSWNDTIGFDDVYYTISYMFSIIYWFYSFQINLQFIGSTFISILPCKH